MKLRALAAIVVAIAGLTGAAALRAQSADSATAFRVFLKNGGALQSYGEYARVGDSLIFTLVVGDGGPSTRYQLITLPAGSVDLDRTNRYRDAVLAARYAATRGETDYQALTADVSKTLDNLKQVTDPQERLTMAEKARQRLIDWSRDHYGYRAKDIEELARLFDPVIGQLRAAAGESQFSVDLSTGPSIPEPEPLQKAPSLRDSIAAALSAASATRSVTDRVAILRTVAAVADTPDTADLEADVTRRLADEEAVDGAYAALSSDLLSLADEARRRADPHGVELLEAEARSRDRALGGKRPDRMAALLAALDAKLADAKANRLKLDHYERVRPALLRYERRVRSVLSTIDGSKPALNAIVDMTGPGIEWVDKVNANLHQAEKVLGQVPPPEDLADVHATLASALRMALEACHGRRLALSTLDRAVSRNASAAAAGAEMLGTEARTMLVARLYPPKIQ
jgi:hypothetical protein